MKKHIRDMVVFLKRVGHGHKVQTLEAAHLDDIVLQTPVLCLERDDEVHVFEQTRDGVCLCAVGLGHTPHDVGGREAVSLHRQSEPHVGVSSRIGSRVQCD